MPKKDDFNEWADTPIRPMRRNLSSRSVKHLDKNKTVEKALSSKEIDEAKKMWSNYHQNSQQQQAAAVQATASNDGSARGSSRATAA